MVTLVPLAGVGARIWTVRITSWSITGCTRFDRARASVDALSKSFPTPKTHEFFEYTRVAVESS